MSRAADWRPLFLDALSAGASVAMAARFASVARRTPYARRERDERFAAAWDRACERGRLAVLRERTKRVDGSPDQLAARIRAVRFALERGAIRDFSDDLLSVECVLDRETRDLRREWLRTHESDAA